MTASQPVPTVRRIADMFLIDNAERTVTYLPDGSRTVVGEDPAAPSLLTLWLYTIVHVGNRSHSSRSVRAQEEADPSLLASASHNRVPVPLDPVGDDEVHGVRLALSDHDRVPGEDRQVLIPCTRPRLTPGFVMHVHDVIGDRGNGPGDGIRVYIGVRDLATASQVWTRLTTALDAINLSYRCKVLSSPSAYPRSDSVVCYLLGQRRDEGLSIIHEVVAELSSDSLVEQSPLCRVLSPGLATADNVLDPRLTTEVSFGQHRCSLIATAVMRVLNDGEDLESALTDLFLEANVDPDDVSRNAVVSAGA